MVSVSIGQCQELVVWHAHKDLEFLSKKEVKDLFVVKSSYSLLWDNSLLLDDINGHILGDVDLYQRISLAGGANLSKSQSLMANSMAANDLEWYLFDRYEKNAA